MAAQHIRSDAQWWLADLWATTVCVVDCLAQDAIRGHYVIKPVGSHAQDLFVFFSDLDISLVGESLACGTARLAHAQPHNGSAGAAPLDHAPAVVRAALSLPGWCMSCLQRGSRPRVPRCGVQQQHCLRPTVTREHVLIPLRPAAVARRAEALSLCAARATGRAAGRRPRSGALHAHTTHNQGVRIGRASSSP